MNDPVEDYLRIKNQYEKFRRQADQAKGALQQAMGRLKEETGADSLKDANKLLKRLAQERDELQKEFAAMLEEFQNKWGDQMRNK